MEGSRPKYLFKCGFFGPEYHAPPYVEPEPYSSEYPEGQAWAEAENLTHAAEDQECKYYPIYIFRRFNRHGQEHLEYLGYHFGEDYWDETDISIESITTSEAELKERIWRDTLELKEKLNIKPFVHEELSLPIQFFIQEHIRRLKDYFSRSQILSNYPILIRAKAAAVICLQMTKDGVLYNKDEILTQLSQYFEVPISTIDGMRRALRYVDEKFLLVSDIIDGNISLVDGLRLLAESRIADAKKRRKPGKTYPMLWRPKAHFKVSLSEDIGINKLGPIPISYVGSNENELLESCAGCELLDTKKCFAVYGTLLSMGFQKAMEKAKYYQEQTSLHYALEHRDPRAKAIRLGVVGDPSRAKVWHVKHAIEKANALGLAVLGYTHHWRDSGSQRWKEYFLASCNNLEEADEALKMGWIPAVVLPWNFQGPWVGKIMTFKTPKGALGMVCPAELDPLMTCNECRMCYPTHPVWCAEGGYRVLGFLDHSKKALVEKRKKLPKKLIPTLPKKEKVMLWGNSGQYQECQELAAQLAASQHRMRHPQKVTVTTKAQLGKCKIPSCVDEVIYSRGLCRYHYFKVKGWARANKVDEQVLIDCGLLDSAYSQSPISSLITKTIKTASLIGKCRTINCPDQIIFADNYCRTHYFDSDRQIIKKLLEYKLRHQIGNKELGARLGGLWSGEISRLFRGLITLSESRREKIISLLNSEV